MNTRFLKLSAHLALGVLALLFAPGAAKSADNITAVYVPGTIALDPADPAWSRTAPLTILPKHINYVDTGCGSSNTTYEYRGVNVRAVHNGTNIFVRFDWNDASADLTVSDPSLFADGMAMMVPFTGGGNTAIQMGTMSGPVNVIMWRADWLTPHNMVAGGIGTVQTSPDAASQNIVHYQRWASSAWTVIVSRPMAAASVNQVTFTRGAAYSIAFANWEGSDWERNGHKNIYNWGNLIVQ